MAKRDSASRILLFSLVPAVLVFGGGLTYLLNVFGIWEHNLFIYGVLLALVAITYALSVGIGFAWRALRR
jgi:hypothetical protein